MNNNKQHTQTDNVEFGCDDNLNTVVAALREGNHIIIDDRKLPMEVVETTQEHVDSTQYPTTVAYLTFRNRTYRLRGETHYPNSIDENPPKLELKQDSKWDMKNSWVQKITIVDGQQILCDITIDDWFGEEFDTR